MGRIHEIKFKGKDLCDAVHEGRKSYEIRKNDRDYQVGDFIECIPIDDDLNPIEHPLKDDVFVITYISKEWQDVLAEGYCVFAIERIKLKSKFKVKEDS